ncbi:DUF6892 domain-containing protein [Nannocystis pusilla]|uniref:DUF6892 domain-containing protein n=1 Tax=Nannocystis pusilla TaxID=889268 RepID=UPI003B787E7C
MSSFAAMRDPSLRLAVVEALNKARKLDLGDIPPATHQYRVNRKTLHALLSLKISDRALAGITELWWDAGGQPLQHRIWPMWHGEDDTFYVHKLAGIEALTGLTKLTLATDADLEPLLELPKLKSARLNLAGASTPPRARRTAHPQGQARHRGPQPDPHVRGRLTLPR